MASFKMMSSSNSRNSDLSRRNSSSASSSPSIRSHNLKHTDHSRTSFVQDYTERGIDLDRITGDRGSVNGVRKSVDDVWKEIVSGEKKKTIMKEEAQEEEDIMTLEDFLAKAEMDYEDVKIPPARLDAFEYNPFQMIDKVEEGSSMRGKRGRVMVEAMDKAAAQRQKRMIKNRESAARSRERKQAYQVELETLAAKLEEENEQLLKEIREQTRERYKKLMEKLIPVDEKKPSSSSSRFLSRSHSSEW